MDNKIINGDRVPVFLTKKSKNFLEGFFSTLRSNLTLLVGVFSVAFIGSIIVYKDRTEKQILKEKITRHIQSANLTCSLDFRQSTFPTKAASCVAAVIVVTIATVITTGNILARRITGALLLADPYSPNPICFSPDSPGSSYGNTSIGANDPNVKSESDALSRVCVLVRKGGPTGHLQHIPVNQLTELIKEEVVDLFSIKRGLTADLPNFKMIKILKVLVLARKKVPVQLILLIWQFNPISPVAFTRRSFISAIKNLKIVRRWALKKVFGSKLVSLKFRAQILNFIEPIAFKKDFAYKEMPDPQVGSHCVDLSKTVTISFLDYLAWKFLELTVPEVILIRAIECDLQSLPGIHVRNSLDGVCLLSVVLSLSELIKFFDNGHSIFGLFRLYLVRVLALDSTYTQYVCPYRGYCLKYQRDYLRKLNLRKLTGLTGPALRAFLGSQVNLRQAFLALIRRLAWFRENRSARARIIKPLAFLAGITPVSIVSVELSIENN